MLPPMIEVPTRELDRPTQKGAADASADDMETAEFTGWGNLGAGLGHDASIFGRDLQRNRKTPRPRLGNRLDCLGVLLSPAPVFS